MANSTTNPPNVTAPVYAMLRKGLTKRQHGANSKLYCWTSEDIDNMGIIFPGDVGADGRRIAPRTMDFPMSVWLNLVEKQQSMDYHIFNDMGCFEWDISSNSRKWSAEVLYENGEYRVRITAEKSSRYAVDEKDFTLTNFEWLRLKDCMISHSLYNLFDIKLSIYVMRDVMRPMIDAQVRSDCSTCTVPPGRGRLAPFTWKHVCMTSRSLLEASAFNKVKKIVDPIKFQKLLREKANEYDTYIVSPLMLYHIVIRFHMDLVQRLLLEPLDIFAGIKGEFME